MSSHPALLVGEAAGPHRWIFDLLYTGHDEISRCGSTQTPMLGHDSDLGTSGWTRDSMAHVQKLSPSKPCLAPFGGHSSVEWTCPGHVPDIAN